MEKTLILDSEQAQQALAAELAKAASTEPDSGLIIFLHGELGAGKTTFARGFLRGRGYEGIVKSPTYTLVEAYELGQSFVYHFDLYRLSDPEELEFTGSRDYFDGVSSCLIEWPEKAAGYLPKADLECYLQQHPRGRELRIRAVTAMGENTMLRVFHD